MIDIKSRLTTKLVPITDNFLIDLKNNWYTNPQKKYSNLDFTKIAVNWFQGTKKNDITGWNKFPYVDVIMGCTQFIESIVIKYGWDGFQILKNEYAYYSLMGKFGVDPGSLEPNKPLIVSLPNWNYTDIRPEWDDILKECEEKNIDIHIDFAWITVARDINFNLDHPNIQSFAMSMSKYNLQWNRIGLRWTRQRSMDSITIFNHYYGDVNSGVMNCGAYFMNNVPRDYGWDAYGEKYYNVCTEHNLVPTKIIHIAKIPGDETPYGIAQLLTSNK